MEQIPFEDVDYWDELKEIMEWTKTHVTSTLHLCWGAQAGIYYHYGIDKTQLPEKMFGVFKHHVRNRRIRLCVDLMMRFMRLIPGIRRFRWNRWRQMRD